MHKKIRVSIFLKHFIVLLGTGFSLFLLIGWFVSRQFSEPIRATLHGNVENYFQYIASEIGSPPDTSKALEMSGKYSIQIIYANNGSRWVTPNEISVRRRFFSRRDAYENPEKHHHVVIRNSDGSRFIFSIDKKLFMLGHERYVTALFLLVLAVLLLHYLLIRHILKPVKWLQQGVAEVGAGNLDHTIKYRNRDELGALSQSFNSMTKKIKEMLRARDQLLLDVSHELRSPVTRMKVALELIPAGKEKKKIQDDVSEIEIMITEILESERLSNGFGELELKRYDLAGLLRQVIRIFEGRLPGIKMDSSHGTLFYKFDADRIRIVLKNILENALKYSGEKSEPVKIRLSEDEDSITVKVSDHGAGIPDKDLPYIFEPFYRVDKSRSKKTGGYGLGLSLCRKIMTAHGGSIAVENNSDRGITVTLRFLKSATNSS